MQEKLQQLRDYLARQQSVAVAFSGGVDSTFLLKVARDVLGDRAVAVTASSCSFPQRELKEAEAFCRQQGIEQIVIQSEELEIEGFRSNPPNRCYLCKRELFGKIRLIARDLRLQAVVEGSNTDDMGDYRPGLRAVNELGILSPLRYAGLNKAEIRQLSKDLGLPTWDKPSFACLASRFVYGEEITRERLSMVERGEQLLLDQGFRQVRVRLHGNLARIEVEPGEFARLQANRERIVSSFRSYGFAYVTMDLTGYRTGSMNETLSAAERG